MAAKKRRRKNNGILPILIAAGIIFILIAALSISFIWSKYSMGTTYADLKEVYGVSGSDTAVFLDNERIVPKAKEMDGVYYMDLDTVRDYIDSRYYYGSGGEIRYVIPGEVVSVQEGSTSFSMQGETVAFDHSAFLNENGRIYLSMDMIGCFSVISWESFSDPNRLYITTDFAKTLTVREAKAETEVRFQAGIKSDILTDVPKNAELTILGELDDWSQVYYNGCIGYVQTKRLRAGEAKKQQAPRAEWVYEGVSMEEPVCMVWHQTFGVEDNEKLDRLLSGTEGVNVVSPTWLSLSGSEGSFQSLAMGSYVEKAHAMGMKVWVLVDDFANDVNLYQILSSDQTREILIGKLIRSVTEVKADGINIDFEYISADTGVHFVEFVRELALECHKNGLVLSIDNFVPAGGRSWVDRKEQGVMADYVVVMSYDEHYNGSEQAGSVASYGFARNGILDTIAAGVPAEKIINGMPFYTRAWTEKPENLAEPGDIIYSDPSSVYGRYTLYSSAVSMEDAAELLREHNAKLTWQEDERQYYGQYEEDGGTVRIWLEDIDSLREKCGLIPETGIAGGAFWKLGLEDKNVWEMIRDVIE